jgi:hypothetical protein
MAYIKTVAGVVHVCEFHFSTAILDFSGTDLNVMCSTLNFDFIVSHFPLLYSKLPTGSLWNDDAKTPAAEANVLGIST